MFPSHVLFFPSFSFPPPPSHLNSKNMVNLKKFSMCTFCGCPYTIKITMWNNVANNCDMTFASSLMHRNVKAFPTRSSNLVVHFLSSHCIYRWPIWWQDFALMYFNEFIELACLFLHLKSISYRIRPWTLMGYTTTILWNSISFQILDRISKRRCDFNMQKYADATLWRYNMIVNC